MPETLSILFMYHVLGCSRLLGRTKQQSHDSHSNYTHIHIHKIHIYVKADMARTYKPVSAGTLSARKAEKGAADMPRVGLRYQCSCGAPPGAQKSGLGRPRRHGVSV